MTLCALTRHSRGYPDPYWSLALTFLAAKCSLELEVWAYPVVPWASRYVLDFGGHVAGVGGASCMYPEGAGCCVAPRLPQSAQLVAPVEAPFGLRLASMHRRLAA